MKFKGKKLKKIFNIIPQILRYALVVSRALILVGLALHDVRVAHGGDKQAIHLVGVVAAIVHLVARQRRVHAMPVQASEHVRVTLDLLAEITLVRVVLAVGRAVALPLQRYAIARFALKHIGGAGLLVTVMLVRVIQAVLLAVAHQVLRDARPVATLELIAVASVVLAGHLVRLVWTVIERVASLLQRNTTALLANELVRAVTILASVAALLVLALGTVSDSVATVCECKIKRNC